MIKILKRYYLPLYIVLSLTFLLKYWLGKRIMPVGEQLITAQLFAIVLTILCGAIYYLEDTKWGPKRRKKQLNASPFKELKNLGFVEEENQLIGVYKNYLIVASYTWRGSRGRPSIILFVFYNSKTSHVYVSNDRIKDLNKAYKKQTLEWSVGYIKKEWSFNFKPPLYQDIKAFLESAILTLDKEGFQPISRTEYESMAGEYMMYLERNKN